MLPAILRAAGSTLLRGGATATAERLIVASRLNKVAGNSVVQSLARGTGASKIPALDKAASYLSKVKPETKKNGPAESKKSSSEKNREKSKDDAAKNQDRQDKAEKEALKSSEESVSLLKTISRDTVRVRDAVEMLLKKGSGEGEGTSGLGKLLTSLTGIVPGIMSMLGGKGGAALAGTAARFVAKGFPAIARMGKAAVGAGSRVLGMGAAAVGASSLFGRGAKAADAAGDVAGAVGRHAVRDPKTGRFISKAAGAALTAATVAPKGILGKAGELGGKAAGMFGKIGGKGAGMLGKGVAKAAGKSLLKKIPIIGAIAGLGLAANRAYAGDWTGAGLEAASGLAGTIPGLGTAASLGLDAALLARDLKAGDGSTPTATAAPATARRPAARASVAAATPAVAQRRTAVATDSMQTILGKMLDLMSDRSKGIYTLPAEVGASTLAAPQAQRAAYNPTGSVNSGDMPTRAPVSTSSLGPVTMGANGRVSGQSMHASGPGPGSAGLGSLSAHYESGRRGSSAIGWDSTGGTSYGKYQIASKTGTMAKFMDYLKKNNPEAYSRLAAAGPADGGKNGAFAKEWQALASEGVLGNSEHDFIKKSHYDVSYSGIKNEGLKGMIGKSQALQDVLWSTSVQHGGAGGSNIFNKVYKDGMSEEELIRGIYAERGTRFGSSTAKVRASVQNRFADESRRALAGVGVSPTSMVRDQAVASQGARRAPVVVQAPQIAMQAPQGKGADQRSTPSSTPVIVRNPDSPVRANVNALIRTT